VEYYPIMEQVIEFIEGHLADPISVEDVAKHAFQSRWHFQRIFRLVTGHSVYSYIKRRRLSEAGNDLMLTRDRIIDISFKFQYETPESFLRAFRKEFSVNPSEYRRGK
jgi:AraC family transcriptional regulator